MPFEFLRILDITNVDKSTCFNITTLLANSEDDKPLMVLFFTENRIWDFMQIVSIRNNVHEMSNPVFWWK